MATTRLTLPASMAEGRLKRLDDSESAHSSIHLLYVVFGPDGPWRRHRYRYKVGFPIYPRSLGLISHVPYRVYPGQHGNLSEEGIRESLNRSL